MNRFGTFLIVFFFLLAAVGIVFSVRHMIITKRVNEQATQTISESLATSTTDATDQVDLSYKLDLPTATTTVPTTWKNYTNSRLGYSISYPSNLILSAPVVTSSSSSSSPTSNTLTLAFPKERYFHWPLQDEVILRITASSTCPEMIVPASPFVSTTTFSINGYSFTATVGDDAAAGNHYQEIAYDTHVNDICYHISLYDHGVNGAGFYVDGQALIQKYDDQHDVDMRAVIAILNSITSSLRLQSTGMVQ